MPSGGSLEQGGKKRAGAELSTGARVRSERGAEDEVSERRGVERRLRWCEGRRQCSCPRARPVRSCRRTAFDRRKRWRYRRVDLD